MDLQQAHNIITFSRFTHTCRENECHIIYSGISLYKKDTASSGLSTQNGTPIWDVHTGIAWPKMSRVISYEGITSHTCEKLGRNRSDSLLY